MDNNTPAVKVKASCIVSHKTGEDTYRMVCFKYDKEATENLKKHTGMVCTVEADDESGIFEGETKFRLVEVDTPTRFRNAPDDVLIVELEVVGE